VSFRGLRQTGRIALGLVLVGLLAGCGGSRDSEQARICRSVVPALNPGLRVTVLRVEPGSLPRSVRVDYEVERIDRPPLDRSLQCQFAGEGLSPRKAELVAVIADRGPISDTNLYLLKRFYLETPEGVSGDPGGGVPDANVARVPETVAYAVQQLLLSMPRTAIYALLASAYALIFGLVGRINLAFGELAAVGSAATVAGATLMLVAGVSNPVAGLVVGLLGALWAGAVHSAVGGHFTIARIESTSSQPSLIATVGLSILLMEYLRIVQSPVTVWLPPIWSEAWPILQGGPFLVSLTPISVVTALIGLAGALSLIVLLHFTAFGRSWRAYADDAKAAALFGVDGPRLLRRTLALAGAMAGLSGMLIVAQYGGLGFAGGFQFGLKALIAAIVGGIGSVPGALLGGVAIGLFETLWSSYLPIEGRDVALYGALVAFLIYRPGGFLGTRDPTPRQI
jgi:branched-chain amino acid transport system permease protein